MVCKKENPTNVRIWKTRAFIATLLILSFMSIAFAQDSKIDINALVDETQKISPAEDEMSLVWWIAEEFWQVNFEQDPNMSADEVESVMEILRPYTIIVAVDGEIGSFGGVTYKPKATIQNNIQIVGNEGEHYRPLSDDKIDPDTKSFLSMMKPFFTNTLGPMGENMHFFLFPSKDKNGHGIAVAKREGTFSVKLDKREFKWRLPLGSLLPQKSCPVDGEKFSGAWKFCPWHGVELK